MNRKQVEILTHEPLENLFQNMNPMVSPLTSPKMPGMIANEAVGKRQTQFEFNPPIASESPNMRLVKKKVSKVPQNSVKSHHNRSKSSVTPSQKNTIFKFYEWNTSDDETQTVNNTKTVGSTNSRELSEKNPCLPPDSTKVRIQAHQIVNSNDTFRYREKVVSPIHAKHEHQKVALQALNHASPQLAIGDGI